MGFILVVIHLSFIKKLYIEEAKYFNQNYQFLIQSRILKEGIIFERNIIKKIRSIIVNDGLLNEFFIKVMINKKSTYSDYVEQYLSKYELKNNELLFKAFYKERLKYSAIRNLLSEFGLIGLKSDYTYYIKKYKCPLLFLSKIQ